MIVKTSVMWCNFIYAFVLMSAIILYGGFVLGELLFKYCCSLRVKLNVVFAAHNRVRLLHLWVEKWIANGLQIMVILFSYLFCNCTWMLYVFNKIIMCFQLPITSKFSHAYNECPLHLTISLYFVLIIFHKT